MGLFHVVFGEAHKTDPVLVAGGVSELAADVVFRILSAVGKGDGEFFVPRFDGLGFPLFRSVAVLVLFRLVAGRVGYVHGWAGKVRPANEEGENRGGEVVTPWGEKEQAGNSPVERQAAKTGTPYRLPCVLDRLPEGH